MNETATTRARRRASREAGPAGEPTTARVVATGAVAAPTKPVPHTAVRPARRSAHTVLVGAVAAATAGLLTVLIGALVTVLVLQQHGTDAEAAREQRFVDTASQTVVNMFSYQQDHIDDSVDGWVADLSGPLRDQFSQPGTVDTLKSLFRETNVDSEVVINAAALERVDEEANRASVLVAARVTATDIDDGVNRPSQPYRLRVVVQEDEAGRMTAYDLFWPNGGN